MTPDYTQTELRILSHMPSGPTTTTDVRTRAQKAAEYAMAYGGTPLVVVAEERKRQPAPPEPRPMNRKARRRQEALERRTR